MADRHGEPLDVRIDSPAREGLTGTTPASVYRPYEDAEQVTIAPDWRPAESQPAWRNDFPIDWPQDHYVERRDFMKFMVLTSLAFTVGQFWIALQNWLRRRRGRPELMRLASLDQLPVGSTHVFAYPNQHDPCIPDPLGRTPVRRLQSKMHAPVVRRRAAVGRRRDPVPMPRRLFRSGIRAPDFRSTAPPAIARPPRNPR
jgi:hypothetical protein